MPMLKFAIVPPDALGTRSHASFASRTLFPHVALNGQIVDWQYKSALEGVLPAFAYHDGVAVSA